MGHKTNLKLEMKRILLSTLALLAFSCGGKDVKELLKENGDNVSQTLVEGWSFRQIDQNEWLPATVPGVVHTDLLANGKIEEPFGGTAEPRLQWIEKKTWEYTSKFTPTAEMLEKSVQELVFKGLDTYADVYLNDSLVLKADNMFLEWRLDVNGALKDGENSLRIVFHPAYDMAEPMAKKYPKLPADNDKGEPYKTSVFSRKAPYSFGWDWGPRFATVGIWRPVQLEGFSGARIANTQMIQKSQSDVLATLDAHVNITSACDQTANVYLTDSAGVVYAQAKVELKKGVDNKVLLPFEIKNPKLWYPNGSGEPNLYALRTIVADESGDKKFDQKDENIGIRTVRLVQQKDSVGDGVGFYFEVNGKPIFAKGANYIPQDNFLPRVAKESYEELIRTTVASNMNMLRVWGGGIYEEEIFYDLCDKNGIMVWQDFIFGCSLYPWDKEFFANVEKEAVYNVRRLRNHPSIVIWCGNNEITELWHQWGYQKMYKWTQEEQDVIYAGMRALFYELLPTVLAAEDTTRFYHPSSPLYGRGDPKSQTEGDVHYWGVFHDEEPFSTYKDKPGRFSNEYGFQSLACFDTYREYFAPEDMKLYSEAMVIHQKNAKGYRVIEEYIVRDLPLLKDDFRTYVYLSQLLQAEGIKIAMEGHRSRRPWTMGSLYWQLNDCWPVASWSSMDSRMRWKALQFYAVKSFAPTIISFEKVDSSATTRLWGITDDLNSQQVGTITVTLQDFNGKVYGSETINANIAANTSKLLVSRPEKEILDVAKVDAKDVMLVARGKLNGQEVESFYYFTPFKNLNLNKADYDVSYDKKGNKVVATIKAKTLLKNVLFEAKALQMNPSDAYFDLLPGETKVVELNFIEDKPVEELGIFVTTLNNLVGRTSEKPVTKNVQ